VRIERVVRRAQPIFGVHQLVGIDDLSDFLARAYVAVCGELSRLRVRACGPAVALYTGEGDDKFDVVAGFPVTAPLLPGDRFVNAELPGGQSVEAIHRGAYDDLADTYDGLIAWLAERDLEPADQVWEEFLAGPDTEGDPARWCTRIVYPLA